MICYKDKTFCPFDGCVKFRTCPDALTKQVKVDAIDWFKSERAPIMEYKSIPSCFVGHITCPMPEYE